MTKPQPNPQPLSFSITQARAQLSRVVDLAEQGHAVQLTRRGRTVAVVVPEHQLPTNSPGQGGWFEFSCQWREHMQQAGLDFMSDDELKAFEDGRGGHTRSRPQAASI
ncbi:MAG: type II toxin-antitoxin system Phd/YefM family antitoxin [Ideonella sp.]|nr:type II toxin-antitoxin system Phd/YefM family antitoxin [Ideonella sp.]